MLQKLQALFNRLRAAGFLLKAKKCELFKEQRTSCLSRSRALQGRTENGKVQSQPNPSLARTKLSKGTKKLARVRRIL